MHFDHLSICLLLSKKDRKRSKIFSLSFLSLYISLSLSFRWRPSHLSLEEEEDARSFFLLLFLPLLLKVSLPRLRGPSSFLSRLFAFPSLRITRSFSQLLEGWSSAFLSLVWILSVSSCSTEWAACRQSLERRKEELNRPKRRSIIKLLKAYAGG